MRNFLMIILLLCPLLFFGQGKKLLKNNKIKSRTMMTTATNKEGVTVTFKDTYEEYDKNGNTVVKIDYAKDGSIKKKEVYKFDGFDNVIEQTDFDKKRGTTEVTTYKYNASGDKTSETVTNQDGKVLKKETYSFDAKRLKTDQQEFDENNKLKSSRNYSYTTF